MRPVKPATDEAIVTPDSLADSACSVTVWAAANAARPAMADSALNMILIWL